MRLISLKTLQAEDSFVTVGEEADFDIDFEGTTQEVAYPFRLVVKDRGGVEIGNFTEPDLLVARSGTKATISKIVQTDDWGGIPYPFIWSAWAITPSGEKPVQWGKINIEKIPL